MNLLVTGAWKCTEENLRAIRNLGHSVVFMQYETDELPCPYEWVEGIVCNGLFVSHPIEKFINLKYIQLTSAGFDRVPMDYVREHGIEIRNARGVYSIPMAEFAVCGVLQLYKQSGFFRDKKKNRIWEKRRGLAELFGKKVVIVGCGSVGTECARRFLAFGCTVDGVDLYPGENLFFSRVSGLEELDSELSDADIIVLTLPLTDETRHLINRERLGLLKPGSVIVNIARGAIIDTDAMIEALPRIGGAVLDVFEDEPLSEQSPLWNFENVILTPHNSFEGEGNKERLNRLISDNLRKCLRNNSAV